MSNLSLKNKSLAQIHLAVLLFGLAGLFGKLISLSPLVIVFGRASFAAMFLFVVSKALKQKLRLKNKKDYFYFIILGVILAIHWTTFFKGIKLSTVAIGLLTFSTFPVFVTFIEPLFFRHRIKLRDVIIALITLIGVLFVIPEFKLDSKITTGALWGIVSGFTFAVLSIMNKKYVENYSGIVIAFYQNFIAAAVLFPFVLLNKPSFATRNLLLIALLGIVFTGISHSLFISSMKNIRAQSASIISSLEPVYGIVATVILFGEIPGFRVIIGGIIILCTAFYATITS